MRVTIRQRLKLVLLSALRHPRTKYAAGAAAGSLMGALCRVLPEQYQLPCHYAAKWFGFLVGGS